MDALNVATKLNGIYRTTCTRLDVDEPWFGAFVLDREGKRSEYRVGTRRNPDERIVDWRHPLARAYYDHRPGDEFELQTPGYVHFTGILEYCAAIEARSRTVVRVEIDEPAGKHVVVATPHGFACEGQQPRLPTSEHGLPDVLALITPKQYRLITASRGQPLIVQGRAGSGKTTVALYRVAWLTYTPDDDTTIVPVDPSKVLIVMFNKALSTFVAQSLGQLKLEGVRLSTFHGWARDAVRRAYRGQIIVDNTKGPGQAVAVRLKKQLGILYALDEFVARQTVALTAWLMEQLTPYQAATYLDHFRTLDLPVVRRLITLRQEARLACEAATGTERVRLYHVYHVLVRAIKRMTFYKEELLKFLTDDDLLAKHLSASADDRAELARYQCALQGYGGTARRPGPKIAFEDLALLLRLIELKHGGFPDVKRKDALTVYDHLVIDEAQDFGAVDLLVLLGAVSSRTGVTIVGDVNQKIIPDADFIGWDGLTAELGIAGAAVATLEVTHRSTHPIMALADFVAGQTPTTMTPSPRGRPGPIPVLCHVDDREDAVAEQVATLVTADLATNPGAHVCVVCARPAAAQQLHARLVRLLANAGFPVRHGYGDDFTFAPGLTVTNLHQVKGLEFDSVIVVDPVGTPYAKTTQGRRNLYTVITRAKDHLRFVVRRALSPLLAPAIERGLLGVETTDLSPGTFLEDEDEPF